MKVINAGIEAGCPLVAPEGGGTITECVGKGAVEELEKLIPFSGVVETSCFTSESYGIMDDVL